MRTHLASARVVSELARVDRDVERLEEQWRHGGEVSLTQFWRECQSRTDGASRDEQAVHLGALVKAELRRRFERGEAAEVGEYLERFPDLRAFDSRVISLIYEEFCLREEHGESVDVSAFCARYPDWKDSLASQLQYHRLFSRAAGLEAPTPRYPKVGTDFEEFQLLSVIGKGGSSRVYLASDRSLGGKRVVLKISLDRGQEPKTQGALDHPHIVPVHSVVFDDSGLRGLSMPYRPGMPLDDIVKRLWSTTGPPRRARALWRGLAEGLAAGDCPLSDDQRSSLEEPGPSGDGWEGFPLNGSFAQGAAWIAMVLARTLHYAHQMRTFHRDVKPGNVLLTLQHGPQLLDFNLAESPHSAEHAESAMLGGTLPYMSPEQIEAFLNPDRWGNVGGRSDLYSLGLVLRELLTGQAPDLPDEKLPPARAMRELLDRRACLVTNVGILNPDVPHALRAIVERCLKLDPEERYADAQALADDLDRFLNRAPLSTASNPSRRERTLNWLIRNRAALGSRALIAVLAGMVAYPWLLALTRPDPARHPAMRQAAEAVNSDRAHEAIAPLQRLVQEYPGHPFPRTYKGIAEALSKGIVANDAQTDVDLGLGLPGSEASFLAWGREHPELIGQIGTYIDRQREFLNELKAKHGVPLEQGKAVERKFHETWLKLINLGLQLHPQSDVLLSKLPEIHDYLGAYDLAYRGLSELIKPLEGTHDRSQGVERLELSTQRDRVAVRWARSLLDGNRRDPLRALELMQASAAEVTALEPFVSSIRNDLGGASPSGYTAQLIYRYYWIATEVWLTLGQVQQEQGRRDEAEADFRKAHNLYRRLVKYGNAYLASQPTAALRELEARVLKAMGRPPRSNP